TPDAAPMLGEASSLTAAGAAELAASALATGRAAGTTPRGSFTLERIGSGAGAFLLATLAPPAEPRAPEPSVADAPAPEGPGPEAAAGPAARARAAPATAVRVADRRRRPLHGGLA